MTDRPDSPEDAVVEEDEGGHGAEAGGQEARPVDVVPDVVGVVAQVGHAVGNLRRKEDNHYAVSTRSGIDCIYLLILSTTGDRKWVNVFMDHFREGPHFRVISHVSHCLEK